MPYDRNNGNNKKTTRKVKKPRKPVMLYDGECAFCRIWIDYWQRLTKQQVTYEPFQDKADAYPQVSRQESAKSIHYIDTDGREYSSAEAVFRSLKEGGYPIGLRLYQTVPGFRPISEMLYHFVAEHRKEFYKLTKLIFQDRVTTKRIKQVIYLFIGLCVYLTTILTVTKQRTRP